jgi:hypothetical protein
MIRFMAQGIGRAVRLGQLPCDYFLGSVLSHSASQWRTELIDGRFGIVGSSALTFLASAVFCRGNRNRESLFNQRSAIRAAAFFQASACLLLLTGFSQSFGLGLGPLLSFLNEGGDFYQTCSMLYQLPDGSWYLRRVLFQLLEELVSVGGYLLD